MEFHMDLFFIIKKSGEYLSDFSTGCRSRFTTLPCFAYPFLKEEAAHDLVRRLTNPDDDETLRKLGVKVKFERDELRVVPYSVVYTPKEYTDGTRQPE